MYIAKTPSPYHVQYYASYHCVFAGNVEDKTIPTLVKALKDHKIVGVGCGSGDAHTIALEDDGTIL